MDQSAVDDLQAGFDVTYDATLVDRRDELLACLSRARALVVRNRTLVDQPLLDHAPNLVAVGRLGVGLDNIDVASCRARNIQVFPATGANNLAVAEYVVSTAMMLLRGAFSAQAQMLAGKWPRQALAGHESRGKTLALVGFGSIARDVAGLAGALGFEVAASDPFVAESDPAWGDVQYHATLDTMLPIADVVSIHVPLTQKTESLLNDDVFAAMKPGAVLINTSRGGIVDERALAARLKSGQMGGAALDVFANEPLSAGDAAKFAGISNLFLTPHIAGVTVESNVRVSAATAANIRGALEGVT